MSRALVMAVSNCRHCKQFEAKPQIAGMQPIICTEPMELVHVDYVWNGGHSIDTRETSGEERAGSHRSLYPVCSSLCYPESDSEDHSHVYLYNEYFSVFGFPQRAHVCSGNQVHK